MPRPEKRWVTFEIDGREVRAPEGSMLVDAAKYGDVEIPVFCYEPKLGAPVGACRMCLVEVEGIPKLQTGCSTPVKDGMVVSTLSDQVKTAQEAVVEFLLVNHPLDCPVCDKGGECPLQDITMGWGPGRSRFIEPKRHFKKPVELSPLVAIDRERCILCYRCVRFSQEVSEDYQLVFLERGDHTFVGTHDGHPYVGPFSGNIIELCPVGALTSSAYRFRARPWDVEEAGSICTMCPSQCNVQFTVRDDARILRVMARDNEDVDDGWLCDRGRFGYQAIHSEERITRPLLNEGGSLRPVSWEKALEAAASGLRRAGAGTAALAGGESTNEEGFLLQRLLRDALHSPHVDSRAGGALDAPHARALAAPELSVPVWDVDNAGAILVVDTELVDEAPIVDLRVRKAARRSRAKVVVATSRPGTLDPNADAVLRFSPGAVEAALAALAGGGEDEDLARRAGADAGAIREAAALLRDAGPVVVIWSERISHGERGSQALAALLSLARGLGLAGTPGAGLLEIPAGTNGRGLREVGCLPSLGPGLADAPEAGRSAPDIARGLAEGGLSALVLLHADPLRTHPDRAGWERALDSADTVVCFSDFLTESARRADVVFPAEAYAEKEGTVTHPDGRLQRLRQAIGRPGEVRASRQVLADLCDRLGAEAAPDVSAQMFEAVPFYAGLTLEEIGGRGVRWQEREAAARVPAAEHADEALETPPEPAGGLRLGTRRSLWAARETEHSPVLRFLAPGQRAELAPEDARRLGIAAGDRVLVSVNGTSVQATAALRAAMPEGTVFLVEGTATDNPNVLTQRSVEVRRA
ncbi:MAG: NADH-quinone oxidoreductase subunit NuoG [Thermoleophilaceae bacterium]